MPLVLICLLFITFTAINTSARPTIKVITDEDNYPDYQLFVNTKDVQNIKYYGGPGARRDVVEIVLFQQALFLGGLDANIQIVTDTSYRRTLRTIETGEVLASGSSIWEEDIDEYKKKMWKSHVLIREKEFVAGFYTSPKNQVALSAKNSEDILKLKIVSNPHWIVDWNTIIQLGFEKPFKSLYWPQMVRMVSFGRADITLAPFQPTKNMEIMFGGHTLVPIQNLKVALTGTRHWAVSKQHPRGAQAFDALQKGIVIMRKNNTLVRAYSECGFFHDAVKNWPLLRPQITQPKQQSQSEQPVPHKVTIQPLGEQSLIYQSSNNNTHTQKSET